VAGVELLVSAVGGVVIVVLAWFFFGPRQARRAEVWGGVQRVEVTVKGGYSPDLIRVQQGVPLRLVFDRQESSDCSARVVFPDFGVSRSLAAFGRTTVELLPERSGEYGFACGMNMLHGTLVVEPSGNGAGNWWAMGMGRRLVSRRGSRSWRTRVTPIRPPGLSAWARLWRWGRRVGWSSLCVAAG
jgi:Cu+-exporting ATPase